MVHTIGRRGALGLLAAGIALLLAACGGSTSSAPAPRAAEGPAASAAPTAAAPTANPPAAPVALTVAYTPASGPMVPLWIGVEEGLFAQQGLAVTAEFVGGSSPIVQAMLSGQYPMAVLGGGAPALNRLEGGDLLMIAAPGSAFSIDAWSKPTITQVADLRGKIVGVTRFGSSTHFAAIAMLASAGLQPDDVVLLQTGGVSESLAALLSGQTDAVMLAPPQNLEAQRAGYHQLAMLSALGDYGLFPELVVTVRESWLQQPDHRALAARFLRGYAAAVQIARTDAATTTRALRKYLKLDDDAVLQATYEYYRTYFPDSLRVPERSVANMLQTLDHPAARTADPRQFFDNSLVDELGL
ncbi:MAG: ABC transporter substrate-binding protein [Chloroflexi bacterium]|nr:ABC transporter substrate-binding protein [Chloroflexota bacterium]